MQNKFLNKSLITIAMIRLGKKLFLFAMTLVIGTPLSAAAADDAGQLQRGQHLYQFECASCHGVEGAGDGPGAYILSQKPRNFQLGVFKLRSTPSGEYPTDQDLFDTISRGIIGATGSMMPSFSSYSQEDRWALVAAVKKFAEIDEPGKPIAMAPKPATVNLTLGESVYKRLECVECHGASGVGDGTSSLTLEDDLEQRIWAPDLTRGRFKGGHASTDIYKRIVTGLDGSPMPAYADKASGDEVWALVEYVLSLSAGAK